MTKIVLIGAGSGFGGKLSRDILSLAALQDAHICLCEIDGERLAASTERKTLLPGADFVVTSISLGGAAYSGHPVTAEVNIPLKADRQSPAGVWPSAPCWTETARPRSMPAF